MSAHYRAQKRFIARRDGGYRCAYCGDESTRRQLTVDHVVPRVAGGSGMRANLVLACKPCNETKGAARDWVPVFALGHESRGVS